MSSRDKDQLVIEEVKNHYRDKDSPYYLAELGKFFRLNNIDVPNGVRFKDYLKSRFNDQLVIVQDPDAPAKIAITPPEKQLRVSQQLLRQYSASSDDARIDHSRLPFALIAAFCKLPLPGTRIYFRVTKPFRYETRMQVSDDNYIEIEDQFRPLPLAGKSVHELSHGDKQTIYEYIENWAAQKGIDLRDLYYDRGAESTRQTEGFTDAKANALQRLINAQEPELKTRIRIPGDIASILMRLQ